MSDFSFAVAAAAPLYTLSLHDALPISSRTSAGADTSRSTRPNSARCSTACSAVIRCGGVAVRSEEHTSELQSHSELVCRLLLEKKKLERRTVRPVMGSPQAAMICVFMW